jgi:hypothetical protein
MRPLFAGVLRELLAPALYRPALVGGLCESSEYQSFNIDKTTGKLKLLGSRAQKFLFSTPLSFSANNVYAYGSDCINYKGGVISTRSRR